MRVKPLLPILLVGLAAAWLRLPGLAERPMHADEAVLADKFGTLLETGRYVYDPAGHHGTVLAYLTLLPALARGQTRYLQLDETTLRLAPVLLGILLAVAPLLIVDWPDRTSLWLAAALIAVSPGFVYYSRCYMPETALICFNALAMAAGLRYFRTRRLVWAIAAGAALGLMYAAKETAVIAFAALAIACAARWRAAGRTALLAAAGTALGVAALFLSSFFLHPAGAWDSLRSLFVTYLGRAFQDPLHRHSWNFYFGVLAWEWPILVLAGAGVWRAVRERDPFLRCLCIYALVLAAVYSALPYKTPWCALNFWFPAILIAGAGAAWMLRTPEIGLRVATAVVLLFGFAHLSRQAAHFTGSAGALNNPYAYAQTGADVFLVRDRIARAARAHPEGERLPIQVVTSQNLWPLPWYLRRYPNVR
ncbi:MAG: TIGR03663 family protein, partial [Acidobacteria bacterium]|nr:TIGR03663 family protein [Acidobacteriota bacterium]